MQPKVPKGEKNVAKFDLVQKKKNEIEKTHFFIFQINVFNNKESVELWKLCDIYHSINDRITKLVWKMLLKKKILKIKVFDKIK